MKGEIEAVEFISKAHDKGEKLATTWINSCELFKGAYIISDVKTIIKIHNLLSSLDVLFPTPATSELYAQLYSKVRRSGKPIGDFDLIIAAICIENGLTLATKDKDFKGIANLTTIYL